MSKLLVDEFNEKQPKIFEFFTKNYRNGEIAFFVRVDFVYPEPLGLLYNK